MVVYRKLDSVAVSDVADAFFLLIVYLLLPIINLLFRILLLEM